MDGLVGEASDSGPWSHLRQQAKGALRFAPEHGAAPVSHRTGGGTGNALQLLGGHHDHRHPPVAAAPAEVGRQIGGGLQVPLARLLLGTLQHHMAAWDFLGILVLVGAGIFFGGVGPVLEIVVTILAVGTLVTVAQRLSYVHSTLRDADGTPEDR